jgi:hypothetical protein
LLLVPFGKPTQAEADGGGEGAAGGYWSHWCGHVTGKEQCRVRLRPYSFLGIELLWFSVPDQSVPTLEEAQNIVCRVNSQLLHGLQRSRGERVVIHCLGGLGRSGTLTACVLRSRGLGPEEAMAAVRRVRPGAIENRRQERFVRGFLPLTE